MSLPTAQLLDDDCARRQSVLARLADNPHLPSPPGIVLEIMEKASRLDCTPGELAVLIHRDAALCGKILKTVNSAFYGLPRAITSVKQAVAFMGLKRLRSLVLSLSLPALQRKASQSPSAQAFWKESVAGATIAHELAIRLRRPNPEDDLVAGLLRDIGVLALQQACPSEYAPLLAQSDIQRSHDRCRLERELLGVDHAEVSAFLLGRWLLPEDIVEPVRHHHDPVRADDMPPAVAERARLLAFASHIAQLDSYPPELVHEVLAFGRQYYGLDEANLAAFLEPLAKKIEEVAVLLELDIGSCEHLLRILARATETLAQLTLETSMDQMRLLEQKRQAEQETQLWRAEANRLRDEAARDALTGTFNRGCLEEQLRLTFRRACRRSTVMGLIFIDIDDFKEINDRYGHLFGDRVLKETAQRLCASVREGDIVARYGGDEFCVLIENTSPERMRAVTVRLGQTLNDRSVYPEGHSVSLGAVVCLPRTCPLPVPELLDVADRAMYAAKSNGKNRITFVSLLDDADLRFLKAIERRRFGIWLTERGVRVPFQAPSEAGGIGARFEAPGRLACRLGWLQAPQRREILREKRATGLRFDEVASKRGLLTQDQLSRLLALQWEPPECLAATLVKLGILSEAAVRDKLQNYYQWLSVSMA